MFVAQEAALPSLLDDRGGGFGARVMLSPPTAGTASEVGWGQGTGWHGLGGSETFAMALWAFAMAPETTLGATWESRARAEKGTLGAEIGITAGETVAAPKERPKNTCHGGKAVRGCKGVSSKPTGSGKPVKITSERLSGDAGFRLL